MTMVRGLDKDGDIITRGNVFIHGRESVAQTIVTRLKLFLGEYHLDIRDGTPWFQSILGKNNNINAVEAILRRRIRQTKEVVAILSFNMDYNLDSRSLNISGSVLTEYGEAEFIYNG